VLDPRSKVGSHGDFPALPVGFCPATFMCEGWRPSPYCSPLLSCQVSGAFTRLRFPSAPGGAVTSLPAVPPYVKSRCLCRSASFGCPTRFELANDAGSQPGSSAHRSRHRDQDAPSLRGPEDQMITSARPLPSPAGDNHLACPLTTLRPTGQAGYAHTHSMLEAGRIAKYPLRAGGVRLQLLHER
jgi:hypothetical protein